MRVEWWRVRGARAVLHVTGVLSGYDKTTPSNQEAFGFLTTMKLHHLFATTFSLMMFTASGHASGVEIHHGFGGCNRSMQPITEAVISYGGQTYRVNGIPTASKSSCHAAYGGSMAIPRSMTIAWTDQKNIRHVVEAPVAENIDDPSTLLSVVAHIYQDHVELIQESRGPDGWRQLKKIYPR